MGSPSLFHPLTHKRVQVRGKEEEGGNVRERERLSYFPLCSHALWREEGGGARERREQRGRKRRQERERMKERMRERKWGEKCTRERERRAGDRE